MNNQEIIIRIKIIKFTLVELLAVIIILGIILAIAIPNIKNIIQQTRPKHMKPKLNYERRVKYVALYLMKLIIPTIYGNINTLQSKN